MPLTVSVICFAVIVCCSNFVFTADCEIHSCEAITHYCDGVSRARTGPAADLPQSKTHTLSLLKKMQKPTQSLTADRDT